MEVSEELQLARRQLSVVHEFALLEDFTWHSHLNCWSIRFSLSCEVPDNSFVAKRTQWYAVVSVSYPWGEIKIYPDKQDGIRHTFQHQDYNSPSVNYPWREGDICVGTSLIKWERAELIDEPFDARNRLLWHIQRTVEWVMAASTGQLAVEGDPFELPQYPNLSLLKVGFNEDQRSFQTWKGVEVMAGVCKARAIQASNSIRLTDRYEIGKDNSLEYNWGTYLTENISKEFDAIWILLKELPVLPPWELPANWGDLFEAANVQDIDLRKLIRDVYLKNRKSSFQFIQLGFPVPEHIGDVPSRMHWLSIQVPPPPKLKGFMNRVEELKQSLNILFAPGKKIEWLRSENWNQDQISSRGKLPSTAVERNFILIGAGALGSLFAEFLIRLGCRRLTIVDDDFVNMGNLSRHTLTIPAVGKLKAQALANHLNQIFPFVNVRHESQSLQDLLRKKPDFLHEFDIIIDATASDQIISDFSKVLSGLNKTFVSVSLGIKANRLFGFINKDNGRNLQDEFRSKLSPWLVKERDENKNLKLPREGIGCWHPVFPARLDDINMLLSAFVKIFEEKMSEDTLSQLIVVQKEVTAEGRFDGIRIIQE